MNMFELVEHQPCKFRRDSECNLLCGDCGKWFQSEVSFAEHQAVKGHTGRSGIGGSVKIKSMHDAIQSGGISRPADTTTACRTCGKNFNSVQALLQHQAKVGHVDGPAVALGSVADPVDLAAAESAEPAEPAEPAAPFEPAAVVKPRAPSTFPCQACKSKFKSLQALQQHQAAAGHVPGQELDRVMKFPCPGCTKKFA
eukprot:gb/GFBE01005518.1/.p1 GENE.gb/GFBE01005518.1/~~gb/GFBE01005518.1/.p1  ORF type:complete len:198 (+),score=35.37 gb/GFBE01005518.1/:1-594(+)